jgi:hypothetical protein
MTNDEVLAYVRATATLLTLPLDDARALRVAEHLVRTATLAQLLDDAPLAPEDEIAEIYSPLAFQPSYPLNS